MGNKFSLVIKFFLRAESRVQMSSKYKSSLEPNTYLYGSVPGSYWDYESHLEMNIR